VKFQRPITEVMWATIPFLITMIVALLVVTYVPQLTEISTPEPPRTAPIGNLVTLVHVAADELTVVKEVTLVDVTGKPIPGSDGKPIVKHLAECDKLEGDDKTGCQNLFFGIKPCKGDEACKNASIANWIVVHNTTAVAKENQIALVQEIPLVTSDGTPKKDKSGNPIVKKLADCAKDSDEDTCRDLFLSVTNCQIDAEAVSASYKGDPAKCTRLKISDWIDSNMSDSP